MGALSPWRNNTTTVCKSPPCPWECTRPRCPRRIIRIIFIIRLTLLCWPSLFLSVLNGKLFRKVTARWRWAGQRAADVFAYSFTGSSRAYHHLRYVAGMVLPLRNAMGDCRRKQLNMGVSSVFSTSVLHYLELFLREFLNRMSFQVFRTAAQLTTRCDVFSNCTLRSVYACAVHETFSAY